MGASSSPSRRGLFVGAGALLASLTAAGLPAAEAADPKHSWAAFLPVFAWMHEGGQAVGQRARDAGLQLQDLTSILLVGHSAPSLMFRTAGGDLGVIVDAAGVH